MTTHILSKASVININPGSKDIVLESGTLVTEVVIFFPKANPISRNRSWQKPIANGSKATPHPIRQKLMLAPMESIDRANPSNSASTNPTTADFSGFFLIIVMVSPIDFMSKDSFLFVLGESLV